MSKLDAEEATRSEPAHNSEEQQRPAIGGAAFMQPPESWRKNPTTGLTALMVEKQTDKINKELQNRRRNPFADPQVFVGMAASRELAKQEAGDAFHKKGKPSQINLDRALPGQVATVLNVSPGSTPARCQRHTSC